MSVWDERFRGIIEGDPEFHQALIKADEEYMDLLDKFTHLKRVYENLTKQYEVAKERSDSMERFRKAAEDLGEYAADLDDKLEAVKAWFKSLPVYTISHLCTVLVPFEDETVAEDRTLYTELKDILEME